MIWNENEYQLSRISALSGDDDEPGDPPLLDVAAERIDVAVDVVASDLQKVADPVQHGVRYLVDPRVRQVCQVQSQADGEAEVGLTDRCSDQIFVSLDFESGQFFAAADVSETEVDVSAHHAELLSLEDGVDVAGVLDGVGLLKFESIDWLIRKFVKSVLDLLDTL